MLKSTGVVMKARLKAILIYLTREGDKVNNRHVRRSDLRLCAHAQSRIVAQPFFFFFSPSIVSLTPSPWLHGGLHLLVERELLGDLHLLSVAAA